MNIGKRLKAYREYHQLTQEDLATKAGVNEKYYGRIERNESCPNYSYITQDTTTAFFGWINVLPMLPFVDCRMTLTFILIEMLFWMAAITVCGTTDIYAP